MDEFFAILETPVGNMEVRYTSELVRGIRFFQEYEVIDYSRPQSNNELLRAIKKQFEEYFSHKRKTFDLPHLVLPNNFLGDTLETIKNIEYGETKSYKEVASILGRSNAPRAVGNSLNRNPVPLIIPCHRVIATNGKLMGYKYGTWRKKWLISFERSMA